MTRALNVDTTLKSTNRIYPLRMIGSTIGFLGMFLFVVFFALWLSRMPLFRGTSRGEAVMRVAAAHPGSKRWAWGCLIVTTLFATVSTLSLYYLGVDTHIGSFFRQGQPLFSAAMLAISSVFTGLVTFVWYHCFAKKNGMDLDEIDIKTTVFDLFKTIVLALTVTGGTLLLVWGAQYFFKTNFAFLYWCIVPFPAAVTAAVPALVSGAGWTWFMVTGVNDMFGAAYTRIVDNLFLTIFLLFVTPLTARGIYAKTRNPYLGGIVNAILAMVITCVNSQIVFPA